MAESLYYSPETITTFLLKKEAVAAAAAYALGWGGAP